MHTLVQVVHPNIASLHAFSTDGARRCLVLELCAGSLDARLEVGLCLNTPTAHYTTRVFTRGSPTARFTMPFHWALSLLQHTLTGRAAADLEQQPLPAGAPPAVVAGARADCRRGGARAVLPPLAVPAAAAQVGGRCPLNQKQQKKKSSCPWDV